MRKMIVRACLAAVSITLALEVLLTAAGTRVTYGTGIAVSAAILTIIFGTLVLRRLR